MFVTRTCTCDLAYACMCVCTARLRVDGLPHLLRTMMMLFAGLRAATVLPLFGVVCSAVRTVLVGVADAVAVVLFPVLDWTGYHINACGAPLGGSFRVPVFFPETRTRVNMDQ